MCNFSKKCPFFKKKNPKPVLTNNYLMLQNNTVCQLTCIYSLVRLGGKGSSLICLQLVRYFPDKTFWTFLKC